MKTSNRSPEVSALARFPMAINHPHRKQRGIQPKEIKLKMRGDLTQVKLNQTGLKDIIKNEGHL